MKTLPESRQPAQIIALFALALVALTAMVGVVVDGGTLYVQRRTAQNAADAASLAGTRVLQQTTVATTGAIGDAVCTYLNNNTFGVTPSGTAYFVASDGTTNLGPLALATNCNAGSPASTIPTGSSGIHVDVTIGPYNTYLAGIVGIRTLQANASATAQVGILGIPNQDLTPLAGCGEDMLQNGNSATPNYNILNPPDYTTINPAYYGYDFILEGSQTPQDSNSTCPAWNGSSSAWKGQVDISGVTGTMVPPMQLPVGTGNSSIDTIIVNACVNLFGASADPSNSTASTSTCYLLVPIANANNPPNQANIVTLGCFLIYDGGNGQQKWRGLLEPINANTCDYGIYQPSWTYGNSFNETQVVMTH